ncbi:MAG: zinc-binding dehydrogenase [Bacteroidetes bacterium]|nr:zinc-binding dehydrogenase [Bacteroidota bacterium]
MGEMMKAVRQKKAGGALAIESVPVPEPGPGEVLVKMSASPINPSDLANISGDYLAASWPFIPGLEGSGTIIKAGNGLLPRMRLGKRVACSPNSGEDGTWAEYMKTSVMKTVPLPGDIDLEQGSMMLVNPMTAMAFMQLAKEGNHPAMVNNAASSSLGKMLIRLAAERSVPLISIVRKEKQVEELKKLGAPHVLNSNSDSFNEELSSLSQKLKASLFLDAVTGKETGRLLAAAPDGSTLLAYARLSGDPIQADAADLIRLNKNIRGFQLGNWLADKSILYKLKFLIRVKKEMNGALSSHVHRTFPMEQVSEAIGLYKDEMSAGKVLLRF